MNTDHTQEYASRGWLRATNYLRPRDLAARLVVIACFVGVAVGVGLVVPRLPTLTYAVLGALAASALVLSVALARMGRTLDPAFVVVATTLLIVPWGVLGLFSVIPMPFVILGLTPFVLVAWWTRPQARRQTVLLAPLLLLALLAAISLAWSSDPTYGQQKLSVWLFTGLMPAAFVLVLAASSRRISWTLILAMTVLTSAYFLLAAAPDDEFGRSTIFGWNPIWASRVAAVGALVALLGPFPIWVRVLTLPILLLNGWAAGALGPVLAFAIGAGAGTIETLRLRATRGKRASVGLLGIWLVLGCVLLVVVSGITDPVLTPILGDPNVTGRADFLAAAPSLFIASPVVGTGLGSFADAGFLAEYPHNLPVEIGAELGILGLLLLIAWWLLALRGAIGSPLLVALLVATSVFTLTSGSLASNEAFWLFTGLAVAMVPLKGRQRAPLLRDDPAAFIAQTDTPRKHARWEQQLVPGPGLELRDPATGHETLPRGAPTRRRRR